MTASARQDHSAIDVAVSGRLDQESPAGLDRHDSRSKPAGVVTAPLTIEAAAERLGVTPRLVRRLVNERRIGFVRVGKFIRLRQVDLDIYLAQHFQPPLDRRTGR